MQDQTDPPRPVKVGTVFIPITYLTDHKSGDFYQRAEGENRHPDHRPLGPESFLDLMIKKYGEEPDDPGDFSDTTMRRHVHFLHMLPNTGFSQTGHSDEIHIRVDPIKEVDLSEPETPSGVLFDAYALAQNHKRGEYSYKLKDQVLSESSSQEILRDKLNEFLPNTNEDREYKRLLKGWKAEKVSIDGETYLKPEKEKYYPEIKLVKPTERYRGGQEKPIIEMEPGLKVSLRKVNRDVIVEFKKDGQITNGIRFSGDWAKSINEKDLQEQKPNELLNLKEVPYSNYTDMERGVVDVPYAPRLYDIELQQAYRYELTRKDGKVYKEWFEDFATKFGIRDNLDYVLILKEEAEKHGRQEDVGYYQRTEKILRETLKKIDEIDEGLKDQDSKESKKSHYSVEVDKIVTQMRERLMEIESELEKNRLDRFKKFKSLGTGYVDPKEQEIYNAFAKHVTDSKGPRYAQNARESDRQLS